MRAQLLSQVFLVLHIRCEQHRNCSRRLWFSIPEFLLQSTGMHCLHGGLGRQLSSWCRHTAARRQCRAFAGQPERPDLRKLAQLAQIAVTDEEVRPEGLCSHKRLVQAPHTSLGSMLVHRWSSGRAKSTRWSTGEPLGC